MKVCNEVVTLTPERLREMAIFRANETINGARQRFLTAIKRGELLEARRIFMYDLDMPPGFWVRYHEAKLRQEQNGIID